MTDAKLYELAVQLAAAEIQCGFIGQATVGRDIQIEERIAFFHDLLRQQWRGRHNVENIEPFPPVTP